MSGVLKGVKVVELAIWVAGRTLMTSAPQSARTPAADGEAPGGDRMRSVCGASPAEVLEDPQAEAVGAFIETEDLEGVTVRSVNSPTDFHGHEFTSAEPPPRLGENTDEALRNLDFGQDEIGAMHGSASSDPHNR